MFVESPNVKGAVAEQAIVLAATKLQVPVLRPVAEHGRCDLALDIGDRLWRVQCKWGRLSEARDVIVVHTGTCRLTPNGYVRGTYTADEVDLFGVYCGELDRCYLLPVSVAAGKHGVQLRLVPPLNGQRACINLAEDFEFEGAIAQLGERLRGTQEVAGSSPASSISSPLAVGCDNFRDHFGYWLDQASSGEYVLVTRRGRPVATLSPPPSPPRLPLADQASAPAPG
jgi:hypothetical protein